MLPTVSPAQARALFLSAQGLCADPARRATPSALLRLVEQLGFVQLDSIQRVERAHHLTLGARLHGYRPELLDALAFQKRTLFEHWTHDASLIPTRLFAHWKPRFGWFAEYAPKKRWYRERMGKNPKRTLARVHERIAREGPVRASDFERAADRPATGWWDWTPEKMALEYLWRTGRVAIAGRDRFQKLYDLIERVLPEAHAAPEPTPEEHLDWACASALERLGAATSTELARYWDAVDVAAAAAWCRAAVSRGAAVAVTLDSANGGKPRKGFALPDWEKHARRAPAPPDAMRALGPFDPVVRDRARLARLFGFAYQFEAFVPAKKRRYGYYVLPLLEGDRFVGRIDPRTDRERGVLVVEKLWWEPGVRPTRARRRALEDATAELARRVGARDFELPR